MTPCAYRIPDTAGGDHACERPSVAEWTHPSIVALPLCRKHDARAQSLPDHIRLGWHRAECAETLQDGPGRPEAAGAA